MSPEERTDALIASWPLWEKINKTVFRDSIVAAFRQARTEALEEAAQRVEELWGHPVGEYPAAIRALKI